MAVRNRQIGWSPMANALYDVLREMNALKGQFSAITPPVVTYYNVAGCERMEYDVIKYNGPDVLVAGTIVSNNTPECWSVIDVATGPENVGTVQTVWNTVNDCAPCIAAHFSNTIYWGEDVATACSQAIPIYARGNGTTFCNSNTFYSEDFRTIGTGTIVISYDGQLKTVNITSGSNVATFNGGCDPCPIPTVIIGTQEWMALNLDVTKYANGDVIDEVTDPTQWANLTTGAWCWYANDSANGPIYGKLYNWYAINDSRGLVPTGFHVPTEAEWLTLTATLGGDAVAGGELKETGTTHWNNPNGGATNSTGFTAVPGGIRRDDGSFTGIGRTAFYWSSSEFDSLNATVFNMDYQSAILFQQDDFKTRGFSIRGIKD